MPSNDPWDNLKCSLPSGVATSGIVVIHEKIDECEESLGTPTLTFKIGGCGSGTLAGNYPIVIGGDKTMAAGSTHFDWHIVLKQIAKDEELSNHLLGKLGSPSDKTNGTGKKIIVIETDDGVNLKVERLPGDAGKDVTDEHLLEINTILALAGSGSNETIWPPEKSTSLGIGVQESILDTVLLWTQERVKSMIVKNSLNPPKLAEIAYCLGATLEEVTKETSVPRQLKQNEIIEHNLKNLILSKINSGANTLDIKIMITCQIGDKTTTNTFSSIMKPLDIPANDTSIIKTQLDSSNDFWRPSNGVYA